MANQQTQNISASEQFLQKKIQEIWGAGVGMTEAEIRRQYAAQAAEIERTADISEFAKTHNMSYDQAQSYLITRSGMPGVGENLPEETKQAITEMHHKIVAREPALMDTIAASTSIAESSVNIPSAIVNETARTEQELVNKGLPRKEAQSLAETGTKAEIEKVLKTEMPMVNPLEFSQAVTAGAKTAVGMEAVEKAREAGGISQQNPLHLSDSKERKESISVAREMLKTNPQAFVDTYSKDFVKWLSGTEGIDVSKYAPHYGGALATEEAFSPPSQGMMGIAEDVQPVLKTLEIPFFSGAQDTGGLSLEDVRKQLRLADQLAVGSVFGEQGLALVQQDWDKYKKNAPGYEAGLDKALARIESGSSTKEYIPGYGEIVASKAGNIITGNPFDNNISNYVSEATRYSTLAEESGLAKLEQQKVFDIANYIGGVSFLSTPSSGLTEIEKESLQQRQIWKYEDAKKQFEDVSKLPNVTVKKEIENGVEKTVLLKDGWRIGEQTKDSVWSVPQPKQNLEGLTPIVGTEKTIIEGAKTISETGGIIQEGAYAFAGVSSAPVLLPVYAAYSTLTGKPIEEIVSGGLYKDVVGVFGKAGEATQFASTVAKEEIGGLAGDVISAGFGVGGFVVTLPKAIVETPKFAFETVGGVGEYTALSIVGSETAKQLTEVKRAEIRSYLSDPYVAGQLIGMAAAPGVMKGMSKFIKTESSPLSSVVESVTKTEQIASKPQGLEVIMGKDKPYLQVSKETPKMAKQTLEGKVVLEPYAQKTYLDIGVAKFKISESIVTPRTAEVPIRISPALSYEKTVARVGPFQPEDFVVSTGKFEAQVGFTPKTPAMNVVNILTKDNYSKILSKVELKMPKTELGPQVPVGYPEPVGYAKPIAEVPSFHTSSLEPPMFVEVSPKMYDFYKSLTPAKIESALTGGVIRGVDVKGVAWADMPSEFSLESFIEVAQQRAKLRGVSDIPILVNHGTGSIFRGAYEGIVKVIPDKYTPAVSDLFARLVGEEGATAKTLRFSPEKGVMLGVSITDKALIKQVLGGKISGYSVGVRTAKTPSKLGIDLGIDEIMGEQKVATGLSEISLVKYPHTPRNPLAVIETVSARVKGVDIYTQPGYLLSGSQKGAFGVAARSVDLGEAFGITKYYLETEPITTRGGHTVVSKATGYIIPEKPSNIPFSGKLPVEAVSPESVLSKYQKMVTEADLDVIGGSGKGVKTPLTEKGIETYSTIGKEPATPRLAEMQVMEVKGGVARAGGLAAAEYAARQVMSGKGEIAIFKSPAVSLVSSYGTEYGVSDELTKYTVDPRTGYLVETKTGYTTMPPKKSGTAEPSGGAGPRFGSIQDPLTGKVIRIQIDSGKFADYGTGSLPGNVITPRAGYKSDTRINQRIGGGTRLGDSLITGGAIREGEDYKTRVTGESDYVFEIDRTSIEERTEYRASDVVLPVESIASGIREISIERELTREETQPAGRPTPRPEITITPKPYDIPLFVYPQSDDEEKEKKKKGKEQKQKRKYAYAPSLVAVSLGITAKKVDKPSVAMGVDVRPIVKNVKTIYEPKHRKKIKRDEFGVEWKTKKYKAPRGGIERLI